MFIHRKLLHGYRIIGILVVLAVCLATPASPFVRTATTSAAPSSVWGIGTLTGQNLHDLIVQMTVSEKDTFVHGSTDNACSGVYISPWVQGCMGQAGWIPGIPTLGIPPLRLGNGPAGSRLGHVATAMPAPIGLTASFNRSMANLFGVKVGTEQRSLNQDVWLAPMMNMVNVPTAGRNFETLGEDPYLAGEMAAQIVQGSQSVGFIATVKHYVDNDFENDRFSTSVMIDERTQHEVELQAFEKALKAGAGAIMCSYNRVNDIYACGNDILLNQIARGLFGFKGFVMSDRDATHTTQDLINGLDMEHAGSTNLGSRLVGYITSGTGSPAVAATNDMPAQPAYTSAQWKAALDNAVFRILTEMNNAGLLEGTQYGTHSNGCNRRAGVNCTPYVPARPNLQVIQPEMFAAAQQVAEASAVLLKNDGNALPLTCTDLTTGNGVVLMGPTAISTYTGGSGSSHVIPFDPVQSSYDALIAAAKAKCGDGVKISYVPGYDIDGPIVPSSALAAPDPANPYMYWTLRPEDVAFANQPGLLRQQIRTAAVPSGSQPVLYGGADRALDQLDPTVTYIDGNGLPVNTAWRWTGILTAPGAGSYTLKIFMANQASAQLFIDGLTTTQRRINNTGYPIYFPNSMTSSYASQPVADKTHDPNFQDGQFGSYTVSLTAGQQLHLDLRVYTRSTVPTRIQFRWIPPTNQADQTAIAVAAASTANKVIDFVWDESSEGSDRGGNAIANGLALAGYQNDVVAAVVAANPNTVVVLNTGDPVFMPWASTTRSILEMWYPGQMGGPATANVLLGNVNPGGKLPETFYDGNAPLGQRFPQDTQPAACANGTATYGTASGVLPGIPGQCPMYPGIYTPGFLSTNLHGYRTINYSDQSLGGIGGNGIFQGYRWFDKNGYTPLFPFGHGLSYTTFDYSSLSVVPGSDGYDVSFTVTNSGGVAGDEVPQVYLGPIASLPVPPVVKKLAGFQMFLPSIVSAYGVPLEVKKLAGFQRITLAAGASTSMNLHINARSLSYWDVTIHDWTRVLGCRPVYVGSSSRDIRLTGNTCLPQAIAITTHAPLSAVYNTSFMVAATDQKRGALLLGRRWTAANFSGKANITDVTDPLHPISLEGNATLQVWLTDDGEPGTSETFGIQVLSKNGGLWFSSNWSGTKTAEQTLGGGNLSAH